MAFTTLPSARALAAVALGLLMLVQPGATPAEHERTVPVALQFADWSPAERKLMRLQNQARLARGIEPMGWRRSLSAVARAHSRKMRAAGTIFHSSSLDPLDGFSWSIAGENVGVGPTAESLFRAFMRSQGHRANILYRRFDRVGAGIAMDGDTIYVTVVFLG